MEYSEVLQLVLKTVAESDFIVISNEEVNQKVKPSFSGNLINITNDLIGLGYIESNSTTKDGRYISGFSIKEKGKAFLKEGGFIAQKKRENDFFNYAKDASIYAKLGLLIGFLALILSAIQLLK